MPRSHFNEFGCDTFETYFRKGNGAAGDILKDVTKVEESVKTHLRLGYESFKNQSRINRNSLRHYKKFLKRFKNQLRPLGIRYEFLRLC